ncbi:MAG: hypothetical protein JNN00_15655 [Chitinophagaceae bacterium]|nr:hypothetical protein [Chitinophagaceae bacterium]
MKIRVYLFAAGLSASLFAAAQHIPGPGPLVNWYEDYTDSTVYTAMQRMMNGLLPVSYFSLTTFSIRPVERILPLREGEGKNGYLLEGQIDQVFPLVWNRNQEDHFAQTSRLSFRYAPALRMSNDDSHVIIPTNQKVGLQFDKVLWDDQTRYIIFAPRGHKYAFKDNYQWMKSKASLKMVQLQLNLMHFSNGQRSGVYASREDSLLQRNDYTKGDFSTNYFNAMIIYSCYRNSLLSAGLGYQKELGSYDGTFNYGIEQERRYGRHRLLGLVQYRTRPFSNPWSPHIRFYDPGTNKFYKVDRQIELRFRLETEYIAGDLSDFKRSKDYRMNTHFFAELNFFRSRSLNVFIHGYYGRDYFNIRYDDIIWAAHVGGSISLIRYRPPRFDPNEGLQEAEKRVRKVK